MPTPLFKRLGIHKQRNEMITISLNIKKNIVSGKTSTKGSTKIH